MAGIAARSIDELATVASRQAGSISRQQLRDLGVSRSFVRAQLRSRRWQRVHPGAYAVFTGPLPPITRVWAALLYAGELAIASHSTAAWLQDLADEPPARVDVCVPHGHRYRASRPGVRVRQSRRVDERRHPAHLPPQTRVEDTVLDLADTYSDPAHVISLVLRACQRRLTTASRLASAARRRKRMRWRDLVRDLVADVRDGVQSALERRYFRDVERAHGLPRGRRNRGEGFPGRRRYRDVRYLRWRVVVELDGRAAHPEEWRERDDLRDNEVLAAEDVRTLRYGWQAVSADPCRTAAQVGQLLQRMGWTGSVTSCGPDCTAA